MGNVFYESLGRITWAVGKHKVRKALTPSKHPKTAIGAFTVLAVGAVVAGAVFARSNHAPE